VADLHGDAILCSMLMHGENNAVVRLVSADHGLLAGYVRGARSARQRAILLPGNKLTMHWRSRSDEQLGSFTLDLIRSRGLVAMGGRGEALALAWVTSLATVVLPERQPYRQVYEGLDAILKLLDLGAPHMVWAQALARFELGLLSALGFGLDLSSCAASGVVDDLVYVSPRSAQAVSRSAGAPWQEKLLPLPAFLVSGGDAADWTEIIDGLKLTSHFLDRHLLGGRAMRISETRASLIRCLADHGH
jgi:DNA repair protein RecO (recombination protein O)